ncbi:virulence factor [Ammoniphilus sp. CFH 90114]|uniref:virulence factor n=1 Tax=Ammoniphilus sp. CFH 90114 TaxID=2493665 RepID=UPI0026A74469
MRILSIEPTPSPNVMKLNMDKTLPTGVSLNFTSKKQDHSPEYITKLLEIEGVEGVFHVHDFIALERHPKADWKQILSLVGVVFGEALSLDQRTDTSPSTTFGEVEVLVQTFKGIPMQVKIMNQGEEMRFSLPERFGRAVMAVQMASENLLKEREWQNYGFRYGTFKEVGEDIVNELSATHGEQRLQELVAQAISQTPINLNQEEKESPSKLDHHHPDWEVRFSALERINPTIDDIPILAQAIKDPKMSIRRLATVYLGMIGKPECLPYLFMALKDQSPAVRRSWRCTIRYRRPIGNRSHVSHA